jgi:hypothetical protein
MKIRRLFVGLVPFSCLVAACEDPPRSDETNSATDDPSLTVGNTMPDPTTTTDEPTTTGESVDDSSSGSTGGPPLCETIDCDGVCCNADEECVLSECREICESAVRCGDDLATCCPDGDVCLENDCVTPGAPCLDSYDCPEGEFCEPTINPDVPEGACLPLPDPLTCEIIPDFEDVELALEWSWEEQQIISIPIVADIDGDDLPEVIVNTTYYDENGDGNEGGSGEGHEAGIIVVFDGTNGSEQFRIVNTPQNCPPESPSCTHYGSYGRATLGVADVDGNDLPDIIYTGRPQISPNLNQSIVHAYNGVGNRLWSSDGHIYVRHGAPAFANFDEDPDSEIVFGATILDNDGSIVWDQGDNGGLFGSPAAYIGALSAIADLTGDGYPEIVSGQHAWSVEWDTNGIGQPVVTVTQLWDAGPDDGYPAIADLDQNGTPEVILVASGVVRVLDGATGELWCGVDPTGAVCDANDAARTQPIVFPDVGVDEDRGGPATIGDFDNDGRPEFAAAGAGSYVVFDLNRDDEDIVQPVGFLPPAPGDIFVRWYQETTDETSRSTGSSLFDFQGDGVSEVLYGDECYTRVYNGATGDIIAEIESSSATIHEYPIVADSDADGNSEILIVANDIGADPRCTDQYPGYVPRRGLFVYGDPNDQWVRTRRVWNSHTYHVTNSDSRGLTPVAEDDNWTQPGLNNYRQNTQGAGVFNAPDLTVDIQVGFELCPEGQLEIEAVVRNEGAQGIPAGIDVSLYEGTDATGMLVGTQQTAVALLPGAFTVLDWTVPMPFGMTQYFVQVDGGDGAVSECQEGNNTATTADVGCAVPE